MLQCSTGKLTFVAGRSILAPIVEAAAWCNAGILLFTKDDDLADENQPGSIGSARQRRVEAGYFIGLNSCRTTPSD